MIICIYIYIYTCIQFMCIYIYIYMNCSINTYIYIYTYRTAITYGPRAQARAAGIRGRLLCSEGGMIRLENIIELKFVNSSFSS